jgi:ornithine cyclodeaminase/alanine dehydrogenase-like protein (mu-crystallin family)
MKKIEFIYLSQEDVAGVGLTMGDAISVVEAVFREHGLGRIENPPKPGIHPQPDAFIHAMPGYLSEKKAAGLKWVSRFSSNARHDIPAVMGLLVLNDVETGQPLALMDCRWITAVRTGCASAVAARFLARRGAEVVGIVGAGIQGRYNLLALKEVLPALKVVRVYDINPQAVEAYVSSMNKVLPFRVEAGESSRGVIEGADVVVTATGKLEKPIFQEKWVKEGALVLPVHHRGWENQVLHKVDKFVTDDWRQLWQAHEKVGGFHGPLPDPYAELGDIVLGNKPGREDDRERIVDFNYGLAVEDVAMAQEIFFRARERGLGTVLTLMEGDLPLP